MRNQWLVGIYRGNHESCQGFLGGCELDFLQPYVAFGRFAKKIAFEMEPRGVPEAARNRKPSETEPTWNESILHVAMNFNKGPFGGHQIYMGIHVHQSLLRWFPIKILAMWLHFGTGPQNPGLLVSPFHHSEIGQFELYAHLGPSQNRCSNSPLGPRF